LNFPNQKLAFVMEAVKAAQPAADEEKSIEPESEQKVEASAPTEEQSTDETKTDEKDEALAEDGEPAETTEGAAKPEEA
jgi:hypothetical protein